MQDRTPYSIGQTRVEVLNAYMRGVYQWMAIGLLATAVTAWFTANSPTLLNAVIGTPLFFVLIIAELGLVFYLAARVQKLSAATATNLFILYSVLNGLTLSVILLAYTAEDITLAFGTSAGMFGAMSIYGLVTKKDLTSLGSFAMMGLFGIIIASIINIFVGSNTASLVISAIGVVVFVALTAYDTQKLREMGEHMPFDDPTAVRRGTILGALTLYLDFINLFLMLLRLFGSSRN